MSDFQSLLLEMDDCKDIYDNGTISRGSEIITKPYMPLLGCMTTTVQAAKAGAEFWHDGFWSRISVVCPPVDTFIDSPYELDEVPVPADLANVIRAWHYRLAVPNVSIEPVYDDKGEPTGKYSVEMEELPAVVCTFGAGVHEAWKRYRSAIKQSAVQLPTSDLDGSYDRLATRAMRIAALLASLENDNRIELWHWAKAQEITERWRKSLHELYKQVNAAPPVETESSKLEDEIIRHMTRLTEKGKGPWFAANAIRDYMPGRSRDEIENRLKMLERVGVCKRQKTAHAMKYRLVTPEDDVVAAPADEEQTETHEEEVYEL